MKWTKSRPVSPVKGQNSEFYWYKEKGDPDSKAFVVELWVDRDVQRYLGLWSDSPIPKPVGEVIAPPSLEAFDKKTNKTKKTKKKGRGIL